VWDAVERARPQAGVVPAVSRDAACTVRAGAWSGVECPSDCAGAGTGRGAHAAVACRISLDCGTAGGGTAAATP